MFPLCVIYYTSNISIEEEHQVFFRSVVNFPDNYRRYCGKSHLRYYDFSPFLLLETPGFSELLWAPSPRPPPRPCPGTVQRSPRPPTGKGTCRAHGMTPSLTQQTFGDGGGGRITCNFFTNVRRSAIFLLLPRRDQQFNRVFHPVFFNPPPPPRELKIDNSLTFKKSLESEIISSCSAQTGDESAPESANQHYCYGELYDERSFGNVRYLNINKNIKTVLKKEYLCMDIKQQWTLYFQ